MSKIGRNDPCPCGSGKKYKKCCEMKEKNKKINAQLLSTTTPTQATKETSKVSSLFFQRASTPKSSPEEPPNPTM